MKLTVVIPTRNRCETLASSLRTCLSQQYDPLEVVVSDNASEDDTREVVESFNDPRIRYVNPGQPVSMATNWEFGLSHVTGDYVTFIGDDDGLMPDAMNDVASLIVELDARVVTWNKAQYLWPDYPHEIWRNLMILPYRNELLRCDSRLLARDMASLWTRYDVGPCLYNSFVSVPAIRRITEQQGGRFFWAFAPDSYSTFAIGAVIAESWYSLRPFSVNGGAAKSNGANVIKLLRGDENSVTGQFVRERDLPLHEQFPEQIVGSSVAITVEAALQANDRVWNGALPIDIPGAILKIAREVSTAEPERYATTVEKLRKLAERRPELRKHVERALRKYPYRTSNRLGPTLGMNHRSELTFDAGKFGVTDVESAARVAANLLGPYKRPAKLGRYTHAMKYATRVAGMLHARVGRSLVWL